MLLQQNHYYDISIHAPAQGATGIFCHVQSIQDDFNSRSRTGSDVKLHILQPG